MRCDGNGGTHRQSAGSQLPALTVGKKGEGGEEEDEEGAEEEEEEEALGHQLLPKTQANGLENLTIESSNFFSPPPSSFSSSSSSSSTSTTSNSFSIGKNCCFPRNEIDRCVFVFKRNISSIDLSLFLGFLKIKYTAEKKSKKCWN